MRNPHSLLNGARLPALRSPPTNCGVFAEPRDSKPAGKAGCISAKSRDFSCIDNYERPPKSPPRQAHFRAKGERAPIFSLLLAVAITKTL